MNKEDTKAKHHDSVKTSTTSSSKKKSPSKNVPPSNLHEHPQGGEDSEDTSTTNPTTTPSKERSSAPGEHPQDTGKSGADVSQGKEESSETTNLEPSTWRMEHPESTKTQSDVVVDAPFRSAEDTSFSMLERLFMAFMSCTLAFMLVFLVMFSKHPDPDPRPVPLLSASALSVVIPPVTVLAIAFGVYSYKMAVKQRAEKSKQSKFWWNVVGILCGFLAASLVFVYKQHVFLTAARSPSQKKLSERVPFSVAFNLSCYFAIALAAMVAAKITNRIFLCQNLDEPLDD